VKRAASTPAKLGVTPPLGAHAFQASVGKKPRVRSCQRSSVKVLLSPPTPGCAAGWNADRLGNSGAPGAPV